MMKITKQIIINKTLLSFSVNANIVFVIAKFLFLGVNGLDCFSPTEM